ncbi:MAG: asparagine synthase (glutamine-hydrolyzing) [bacterium]
MCGIVGFVGNGDRQLLEKMADQVYHRGPDDKGFYFTSASIGNVGFGFRRLAIIDIRTGQQPMFNEDETIAVIFNGEIYNFNELKIDLIKKGHQFVSNSDTEAIVHLYEELGEDAFSKLNGMFAIAIWDKRESKLVLARDRLGQKPLYYGLFNKTFIFSSEIKSALKHPEFNGKINNLSLAKYFFYEYVPTPDTIFSGFNKLKAGHYLIFKNGDLSIHKFWDVKFNKFSNSKNSISDLLLEFDRRLTKSVEMRLLSDVPLGIFLSGGLDSSLIAYYSQKIAGSERIKTFSIGFQEQEYDESAYARQVADHLHTDHHEQILDSSTAIDLIPSVADFLDEPMADYSIIPTYLLSKFTKEKVTVALGGDGGDELLMGYPTFLAHRLADFYRKIFHNFGASFFKKIVSRIPSSFGDYTFDYKLKVFFSALDKPLPVRQEMWLGAFSLSELENLFLDGSSITETNILSTTFNLSKCVADESVDNQAIYLYLKQYLSDEILVKVDRASMANSLEVRAPFLDYTLVDFICSLPSKLKLKGLTSKYLLKELAKNKLPENIINRRKKGFSIPLSLWLRKDLKDFMTDLLSEDRINRQGIFNYSWIEKLMKNHLTGKVDERKKLWTLLVFQMWFDRWAKN